MKFGENLKKLRKSRKMSQEDLAEMVGVSRQSVSKWETSESYPEMNNILQLCKIFHCHINDLVNDTMVDIEMLDEEVKKSVVKLRKDQQKKMKLLSKIIVTGSRISRNIVSCSALLVLLVLLFLPWAISNTKVDDGKLYVNGNQIVTFDEVREDGISIHTAVRMQELFEKHSKMTIIIYMETGFVFLFISVVLIVFLLKHLEQLFENIQHEDTPFTLDNVHHIKKITYYLIAVIVLPAIGGFIFEILMKMNLDVEFEFLDLVVILFLSSMSYIFEYGYEIQLDSNGRMYDNE